MPIPSTVEIDQLMSTCCAEQRARESRLAAGEPQIILAAGLFSRLKRQCIEKLQLVDALRNVLMECDAKLATMRSELEADISAAESCENRQARFVRIRV